MLGEEAAGRLTENEPDTLAVPTSASMATRAMVFIVAALRQGEESLHERDEKFRRACI